MCMNVLWFNFIHGLIFVCGSLALSHQSPACRTHHFAPPYSRKKCKFNTNAKKKTEVKVTKVKIFFFHGCKSKIRNFVLFCFSAKRDLTKSFVNF